MGMIVSRHTQPLVFGSDLVIGAMPGGAAPCWYLTFDAVPDDYIALAGLACTPPYTIVAWTRRRVAGVRHSIIGLSTAVWPYFDWNTINALYGRHNVTSNSGALGLTTNWNHVAVVHPGGGANSAVFYNGVNVTTVGAPVVGALNYNRIGYRYGGAYFDGQLAALSVAPVAINVAALFAAGTFHKPLDPTVWTLACWNMRQESGLGTTLIDEAIGNNGVFKAAGEPAWGGLMSVGGPAGWSDT